MTRTDVAEFVDALILVYVILILIYIVVNFLFAFGLRPGYYRWLDAVLEFLRDVSEPWLRIFRRLPLRIGPLDLTPIVAILALQIGGNIIVALVRG